MKCFSANGLQTFSKPFKIYLSKHVVENFINNMIEESKYCSNVMKEHVDKQLVMTKEDNEDFKNSTKFWICDNDYADNYVRARDHSGKYRDYKHRDCNSHLKLNHKIPVIFHNLKII